MTDGRAAGLYAATFVPAAGAAVALNAWVMDLSKNQAPRMPSGLDVWALNVVPALAAGLLVYFIMAHFVHARLTGAHSLVRHIRRSAAPYFVALGLGALLLHDGRSPDFWTFGQIVLWPWLVAVAGIAADGLTAMHARRRTAAAVAGETGA
jgi:ABC-type amino acid transport system permease subunit